MNGISEVLNRINEIQNKINKFQPESVEQFKQNYSAIQEKYYNKLKQSSENQQDNKQTSNNVNSVEQNQNINSLKPLFNGDNAEYLKIIKEASNKFNVPEQLIGSIIKQESAFKPMAVSHAGAKGLMQLMPQTAKEYGVKNIFDPKENIFAGTKHFKDLLNRFNDNIPLSLAAYNAGINRVIKAKGIPNIEETKNYVKNVINNYQKIKDLK